METYSQLTHSETRMQQHGGEPQVHAYVLVIPKMEGPVLETLQKLLAALSTQEPVVLPLPSRKAALEVVDSWLEHSAAAEYLGVGRSTLYRLLCLCRNNPENRATVCSSMTFCSHMLTIETSQNPFKEF